MLLTSLLLKELTDISVEPNFQHWPLELIVLNPMDLFKYYNEMNLIRYNGNRYHKASIISLLYSDLDLCSWYWKAQNLLPKLALVFGLWYGFFRSID